MSLSLHASIAPESLPADTACDVQLQLVLRNDGAKKITIYPGAAKLSAIASYAGVGISWALGIADDRVTVPMQELRRWYGPPGNPPSPRWTDQFAVALARGKAHSTTLLACWIPNPVLAPRHLDPKVLDPDGMDNIAAPSRLPGASPLVEQLALAQASVLVFGAPWATLETAMRAQDDFLRGHVVAFVPKSGEYSVHAQYLQDSWMGVGTKLHSAAATFRMRVG